MIRPYTRSLDPQDYSFLPHAADIRRFRDEMPVGYTEGHEHKFWENASIMQQLVELSVPTSAKLIDVGSGGMFFPPYLAVAGGYKNLHITDSMSNFDIRSRVQAQASAYGIELPVTAAFAENMNMFESESFDVVMCISVIEHVKADRHDDALRELCRMTKPGGYLFITSDFFRSGPDGKGEPEQIDASPYKYGQETCYTKEFVLDIPNKIPAMFVGDTDLDYRGDFVHNYSFVNICLQKVA